MKTDGSDGAKSSDVEIRGEGALIRLSIFGYERPDATEYWDANWLRSKVLVSISGFRADFPCACHSPELERFRDSLQAMSEALSRSADYSPMEPSLVLRAVIDTNGAIDWECTAEHPLGIGATLRFRFRSDQSYLRELIAQLSAALREFPVRGEPT